MRKKSEELNWQELRDQLWSMVCDSTEETRDIVEVDVERRCIDIYPAETNTSNALFHTEEVVDFCRYWGLSNWTGICLDGKVSTHIY